MTRKVVSIKKLKEDLHLERMVQYFLKRYSDDLDEYVYTRKKSDLGKLLYDVQLVLCCYHFNDYVCTNDIWQIDYHYYNKSPRLTYTVYYVFDNHLCTKSWIRAILHYDKENDIYTFKYDSFEPCGYDIEDEKRSKHDLEVGKFMLQCCLDLLNDLLRWSIPIV